MRPCQKDWPKEETYLFKDVGIQDMEEAKEQNDRENLEKMSRAQLQEIKKNMPSNGTNLSWWKRF